MRRGFTFGLAFLLLPVALAATWMLAGGMLESATPAVAARVLEKYFVHPAMCVVFVALIVLPFVLLRARWHEIICCIGRRYPTGILMVCVAAVVAAVLFKKQSVHCDLCDPHSKLIETACMNFLVSSVPTLVIAVLAWRRNPIARLRAHGVVSILLAVLAYVYIASVLLFMIFPRVTLCCGIRG